LQQPASSQDFSTPQQLGSQQDGAGQQAVIKYLKPRFITLLNRLTIMERVPTPKGPALDATAMQEG
jgi:hypothetical protein